jgi:hypothetical protein
MGHPAGGLMTPCDLTTKTIVPLLAFHSRLKGMLLAEFPLFANHAMISNFYC